MNLTEFLDKHDACGDGRKWALATGCETIEEIWLRDDLRHDWRLWIAQRTWDDVTLRRFACRCVREVWHLLTDERSRHAVEVAERFCEGLATQEELSAARAAAWAAWEAAEDDPWAAARAAAWAAEDDPWAAAWAAARARQNEIMRELVPTLTIKETK